MATYIDRETYRNRLADLESWCQDLRKPGLKQALEVFDEVPAADVVEVVRCRDCKHCDKVERRLWCMIHDDMYAEEDYFCASGERREAGT